MILQTALSEISAQAPSIASPLQFPSPSSFFALGDSYSAGIGANCGWIKDEFDSSGSCLKCNGGYPYQIIEISSSQNPSNSSNMSVYHLGCTGASMTDITSTGWNNRTSQLSLMSSLPSHITPAWGTLSIGGNDVGFANIVANCIMFDRPSCDTDLNTTETRIADPRLLSGLISTYLQILGTAHHRDFRLIVPSYAQFFNAETEHCDNQFIFYGRYLTKAFRARLNAMIAHLNLLIRIAVSVVQLQLVFADERKGIFFEDWDALFEGRRFCEVSPKGWGDAWFFTINGEDLLPGLNGTVGSGLRAPDGGEGIVDLSSVEKSCRGVDGGNLTAQMICDWAKKLEEGREPIGIFSTSVYPWWITKTMHPKSIAHWELAKQISRKWMNGYYF